jgi:hypothetical protein
VQLCINAREWLSRQMDAAGLAYTRQVNCFTQLSDPLRAQQLLDEQLRMRRERPLSALIEEYHPMHRKLHEAIPLDYYWTIAESEYATDITFKRREDLERIYPALVHHSVMSFGAEQVPGFLGREQPGQSEVSTDRRRREPGVRVKHWLDENSLKLYDKGSVLRSEVTINEPMAFRVHRQAEGDPHGKKSLRVLRRSVADTARRAQVSRAVNERHLGTLAATKCEEPLGRLLRTVCAPAQRNGQRHRALRPFGEPDMSILREPGRAEHLFQGVRHRDVRKALKPHVSAGLSPSQMRGRVSRLIQLLRAHRLLLKISGTHRYRLSANARKIIPCVLATSNASTPQLTLLAA